jgi:hypothetical protein
LQIPQNLLQYRVFQGRWIAESAEGSLRVLLIVALGLAAFAYRSFGRPLDGSAWDVHVRRQALFALGHKDTLIFDRGRFSSMSKTGEGFKPSGYDAQAEKAGSVATWQAESSGQDGSLLEWNGQVDGDRMRGTLVWTRKDGTSKAYSFSGRRRA